MVFSAEKSINVLLFFKKKKKEIFKVAISEVVYQLYCLVFYWIINCIVFCMFQKISKIKKKLNLEINDFSQVKCLLINYIALSLLMEHLNGVALKKWNVFCCFFHQFYVMQITYKFRNLNIFIWGNSLNFGLWQIA